MLRKYFVNSLLGLLCFPFFIKVDLGSKLPQVLEALEESVFSFFEVLADGVYEDGSMIFHKHLLETCASLELHIRQPGGDSIGGVRFDIGETSKGNVGKFILIVGSEGDLVLNGNIIKNKRT